MFSFISRLPLVTQRCSKKTFIQLNCLYDLHLNQCRTRTLTTTKKLFNTSGKDGHKIFKKSPITWKSVGITALIGAGILGVMLWLQEEKDKDLMKKRKRAIGKAAIGGKFDLVNYKGESVKSSDFLGQWVLIYFGFTHCPDVCPDEIEKMTAVVDKLETEYNVKVAPIFITVDPDRDTPEAVEKYVKEFSPKLIGLSGSKQQIAEVCRNYRVYYSNGPKVEDDYIVDHTIIIYLVDPDGGFVDYYGQTHNVDQVVNGLIFHKAKYDRLSKGSWLPELPFGNKATQAA